MRAVRLHAKGDIRFETVEGAAHPGPGEVRVAVAFAGICGSDIHNFKTGQWITRAPSVAGHEFSGRVESIGADVTHVSVGDHVVADSRYYCGNCDTCRVGEHHLCRHLGFVGEAIDGGFAEYVTLPGRLVLGCDHIARLDVAALAEPLAVALHAVSRLHAGADDPLLITGCGPIGALCAIAVALTSSRRPLLVCDRDADRVAHVAQLSGATAIDLAGFQQFQNVTGRPIRHVIDTTGNIDVISRLVSDLSGATLCLVGIGAGTIDLNPVQVVENENTITGCHAYRDELPLAIDMLAGDPDAFAGVIGDPISLRLVPDAYHRLAEGPGADIKTMIGLSK